MIKRTKKISIFLLLLLIVSLFVTGCSPGGQKVEETGEEPGEESAAPDDDKMVLRCVSFLEQTTRETEWLLYVIDIINNEIGDKIEINYLGGPDAIPGYELGEALDKGVVDFVQLSFTWLQDRYPEAQLAALISDLSPEEQRKLGVNEYFNEGLQQANTNIVFLGMCGLGYPITLYTNFPVDGIEDFKGKICRISPLHQIAAESLGMETMTTSPGEMYSAVERKIVDAYYWPAYISDYGLHEITQYRIHPGFGGSDAALLINRNIWNEMSTDLRNLFQDTINEALDKLFTNMIPEKVEKEERILEEHGVVTIVLPDEFRNIQIDGYKQFAINEFGERGEAFFAKFLK